MTDRSRLPCILFDWGDTLMRDIKEFTGPMKDWPRVEAIPDTLETLTSLHPAWRLCLATNAEVSTEMDIREALERVDLVRWFDRIYCFKSIGIRKPSPGFFHHILTDLGLPPERVIMVGDNFEADVFGAARLGMKAIWFNEKDGEERRGEGIRTVHRLAELPAVLKVLYPG